MLKDSEINLVETAIQNLGSHLMQKYKRIEKLTVTIEKTILPGAINKGASVRITETFQK